MALWFVMAKFVNLCGSVAGRLDVLACRDLRSGV